MTRITIHTIGTRGDVQPYIALGMGLRAAGFDVNIATAAQFRDFVTAHGLAFAPLPGDMIELINTPAGKAAMSGSNKIGAMFKLLKQARPMFEGLLDAQWAAAQGADYIVYHPKAIGGGAIAEKLGIPASVALPLPALSPTRAFPSPLLPFGDLGPFNRLSHRLICRYGDLASRSTVSRWRKKTLGLPARAHWLSVNGRPVPRLYPYCASVVPRPADWDKDSIVTGYWFLDDADGWQPPEALQAFLDAGPPPVYVGFGSLPTEDAERMTNLVLDALAKAGQRGILATGWGGMAAREVPPAIHMLEAAPHDWLFPRMAAVVHHGGAGTTAAGLRARKPSVICPFFGDQPFWGRRIEALGVGPTPIPQRQLTAERLADAISRAVGDPAMRQRAEDAGRLIAREDGTGKAIAFIQSHLAAIGTRSS